FAGPFGHDLQDFVQAGIVRKIDRDIDQLVQPGQMPIESELVENISRHRFAGMQSQSRGKVMTAYPPRPTTDKSTAAPTRFSHQSGRKPAFPNPGMSTTVKRSPGHATLCYAARRCSLGESIGSRVRFEPGPPRGG